MYTLFKKRYYKLFLPNLANLSAYDSILFSSAVFKTLFFPAARDSACNLCHSSSSFSGLLENIFPWQGDVIKSQENLNLFLSIFIELAH